MTLEEALKLYEGQEGVKEIKSLGSEFRTFPKS